MIDLQRKERPKSKPIWMCWQCYFEACANEPLSRHCPDCETNLLELDRALEEYDQQ